LDIKFCDNKRFFS